MNEFSASQENSLDDLLRQLALGRGGMGVVYEAEQISLCRREALKILPFAATRDAGQPELGRLPSRLMAIHQAELIAL